MWLAVVAGGIILVLLIIFIAQNTEPATIPVPRLDGRDPARGGPADRHGGGALPRGPRRQPPDPAAAPTGQARQPLTRSNPCSNTLAGMAGGMSRRTSASLAARVAGTPRPDPPPPPVKHCWVTGPSGGLPGLPAGLAAGGRRLAGPGGPPGPRDGRVGAGRRVAPGRAARGGLRPPRAGALRRRALRRRPTRSIRRSSRTVGPGRSTATAWRRTRIRMPTRRLVEPVEAGRRPAVRHERAATPPVSAPMRRQACTPSGRRRIPVARCRRSRVGAAEERKTHHDRAQGRVRQGRGRGNRQPRTRPACTASGSRLLASTVRSPWSDPNPDQSTARGAADASGRCPGGPTTRSPAGRGPGPYGVAMVSAMRSRTGALAARRCCRWRPARRLASPPAPCRHHPWTRRPARQPARRPARQPARAEPATTQPLVVAIPLRMAPLDLTVRQVRRLESGRADLDAGVAAAARRRARRLPRRRDRRAGSTRCSSRTATRCARRATVPPPSPRCAWSATSCSGRGVARLGPASPGRGRCGRSPAPGRAADLTVGNLESTLSDDGPPQQGDDSFAAPPGVARPAGGARLRRAVAGQQPHRRLRRGRAAGDRRPARRRPDRAPSAPGVTCAAATPAAGADPRGVRFGFLGFNAIGETPQAAPGVPGRAVGADAAAHRAARPGRPGPRRWRRTPARAPGRRRRGAPPLGRRSTPTSPSRCSARSAGALVEAGADLVVGGHPHWVQGLEQSATAP